MAVTKDRIVDLGIPSHIQVGGKQQRVTARAQVRLGKELIVTLDVPGLVERVTDLELSRFVIEGGELVQLVDLGARTRAGDDERFHAKALAALKGAMVDVKRVVRPAGHEVISMSGEHFPVPYVCVLVDGAGPAELRELRRQVGDRCWLALDDGDGFSVYPRLPLRELFARLFEDDDGALADLIDDGELLELDQELLSFQPARKTTASAALLKRVAAVPTLRAPTSSIAALRKALAAGKRVTLPFEHTSARVPRVHARGREERRVVCALELKTSASIGRKRVTVRYGNAALLDNGLIKFAVEAPGLVAAVGDDDPDARLEVKDGALVRVVDLGERAARAKASADRKRDIAAVRKVAADVARALRSKGAVRVIDEEDELPFARLRAKVTREALLDVQHRFRAQCVVTADSWDVMGAKPAGGVRVYAPLPPAAIVCRVMKHPFGNGGVQDHEMEEAIDALVDEAGARLLFVSDDTLVLWPTKKPTKLPKSVRAIGHLSLEDGATPKQYVSDVKAGRALFFWWD